MDALHRTGVNGFLDFIFRGAAGVDHLGKPPTLVESEDLRAQLFASAAGDALLFHYIGEALGHVLLFIGLFPKLSETIHKFASECPGY
jgi:uncharacterized membrane protein YphA (DoxX/SURF4 family)